MPNDVVFSDHFSEVLDELWQQWFPKEADNTTAKNCHIFPSFFTPSSFKLFFTVHHMKRFWGYRYERGRFEVFFRSYRYERGQPRRFKAYRYEGKFSPMKIPPQEKRAKMRILHDGALWEVDGKETSAGRMRGYGWEITNAMGGAPQEEWFPMSYGNRPAYWASYAFFVKQSL